MARTQIQVTVTSRSGVADPTPTACDVPNGNYVINNGFVILRVKNTNAGSTVRNLSVVLPHAQDGQLPAPRSTAVAAGAQEWFGPYPPDIYGGKLSFNGDHAELVVTAFGLA